MASPSRPCPNSIRPTRPDEAQPHGRGGWYLHSIKTFLYLHCKPAHIDRARAFYRDVLALTETFASEDEGIVGYQVGELQITIEAQPEFAGPDGWAKQLGWRGGSSSTPSFGIELTATGYAAAIDRAIAGGVECWRQAPDWVGYWSFPVRDPMGHTVELSSADPDAWSA